MKDPPRQSITTGKGPNIVQHRASGELLKPKTRWEAALTTHLHVNGFLGRTSRPCGANSTAAPPSLPLTLSQRQKSPKLDIVKGPNYLGIRHREPPLHQSSPQEHTQSIHIKTASYLQYSVPETPATMAAATAAPSAPSEPSSIFAVPRPIRSLFKLFPLRTYEPEPLPARAPDQTRPRAKLYVFSSDEDALRGRPSFNPTCLKWQVRQAQSNPSTACL